VILNRAVIGVPLYTLARYRGMGEAPSALRAAGIVGVLRAADDLGDVALAQLTGDSGGRVKNLDHFRESTLLVYNAARSISADSVVVLGGECSETVGIMAGLAEEFKGRPGMLWLDAHGDFNTPETSPSGYIGGMCLALATGRGPSLGLPPSLADERLVHLGSRDLDPAEEKALAESQVTLVTSRMAKERGAAEAAKDAAKKLDSTSDWIVCHLDVDVVDPELIPAVNYPTPGGLGVEEVAALIRALSNTGKLRLLELAAYNPAKDRSGASVEKIVELLRSVSN
jgi:arginase